VRLDVAPTPAELDTVGQGTAAVVIDVFRASSTIVTALAAGARFVLPTADVEQAVRLAAPYDRNEAVLGGERECRRIEGFALGNSPREYTRETVGGKAVIFTTSNGTGALLAAQSAGTVLVGCFLNTASVVAALGDSAHVVLLCAGNCGRLCFEDFVCAGAFADLLADRADCVNDAALAARAAYLKVRRGLRRSLLSSDHAHKLADLGFGPDLDWALGLNSLTVVPVLRDGRLIPLDGACASPSASV
jgi:2-phosphosulfolactate phosphatase